MSTPYSNTTFPPKPILNVQIGVPGESAISRAYPAFIDTGSDFTLIPLSYLLEINAPESRAAFVRGLFSQRQIVTLYYVDLQLDIGRLVGIEVIGLNEVDEFDSGEIILGRNILNKLHLFLDGPDQTTYLLERKPRRF